MFLQGYTQNLPSPFNRIIDSYGAPSGGSCSNPTIWPKIQITSRPGQRFRYPSRASLAGSQTSDKREAVVQGKMIYFLRKFSWGWWTGCSDDMLAQHSPLNHVHHDTSLDFPKGAVTLHSMLVACCLVRCDNSWVYFLLSNFLFGSNRPCSIKKVLIDTAIKPYSILFIHLTFVVWYQASESA